MSVEAFVAGGGGFPMGDLETFERGRPAQIPDPYNPEKLIDSGEFEWVPVQAFLASMSSIEVSGEVRLQVESSAQLVIPDAAADIQRGDLIRQGKRQWKVEGFPESDTNPFTGWRPTLVANLSEVLG